LRRNQRIQKAPDRRRGLGADKLGDDPAIAKALDRRDSPNPERTSELRIRVHIELDQLDGSLAKGNLAFEHGPERAAGTAPFRPEVDDYGYRMGSVDHRRLEGCFGYVHV